MDIIIKWSWSSNHHWKRRVAVFVLYTILGFCSGFSVSPTLLPNQHHHHHIEPDCDAEAKSECIAPFQFSDEASAQAGRDGFSILRRPLRAVNWDPNAPWVSTDTSTRMQQSSQDAISGFQSHRHQISQRYPPNNELSGTQENTRKNIPSSKSLDLMQRSLDALDIHFVLEALWEECRTVPAKLLVQEAIQSHFWPTNSTVLTQNSAFPRPLLATSLLGAQERYQAVQEMQWLLDNFTSATTFLGVSYVNRHGQETPLIGDSRSVPILNHNLGFHIDTLFQVISTGHVLGGQEILQVADMISAMDDVKRWSATLEGTQNNTLSFHAIPQLAREIQVNSTLLELLEGALDEDGLLSGTAFPILGQLRDQVRSLRSELLSMLENLLAKPSIQSKLALESGGSIISEVSNGAGTRLVIPVDPKYALQVGIVHDASRSGKTVYVEPRELQGPTNVLRQMEDQLSREASKIWRMLTDEIWSNRHSLQRSVHGVAQLDLVLARYQLGRKLKGVIPQVQDEGVISLQNAKHPVLLLRNQNVVGNDIELGKNGNQGLVLTGPNSGGKTVILKLLGLVAFMVRCGIPVPAQSSTSAGSTGAVPYQPRVDFFNPILANIGDIQSVGDDLSTFSGHMLVCRQILSHAGRNSLVLMDELGSGTDPAQGVAIAQALLEVLVETGCRVAITTHYSGLKQLAAADPRFSVSGMEFMGGRPTFKLLPGIIGGSFALAVAERLDIPKRILDRANELLDDDTRQMGVMLKDLEVQRARVQDELRVIECRKKELKRMERDLKQKQLKLERKMLTVRKHEAKKFAKKLEEKEKLLEEVVEKLKSNLSRKDITKSRDEIKFIKREALDEAEKMTSAIGKKNENPHLITKAQSKLVPLAELRVKPELNEGDKLVICRQGSLYGRNVIVEKQFGRSIEVRVDGITLRMKLTDLALEIES